MREKLLEALMFFLERPSVIGSEKALCDDLQSRIGARPGWRIERIANNNLVVDREQPNTTRERVAFVGHLDTVPEPEEPIKVRAEGDRVHGRGASDMKAGDAVMLALLEGFDWAGSWAEPLFVFYEREEGPYAENGLEVVFAQAPRVLKTDLALVLEPTENALEAGCAGTAQVEVTFLGKPAHAARPWQGENALSAAGAFLAALDEREPEEVVVEGLSFYDVLTPTMARGGRAKNIVPDGFWINVNHRFPPGRGVEHVESVFDELLEPYGGRVSYEIADFAPSGSVDLDHPLLRRFLADGLPVRPKQAWTDVARFAREGVSAVNFGPGSPAQAHQRDEYADIPLLVDCHERLGGFLKGPGH